MIQVKSRLTDMPAVLTLKSVYKKLSPGKLHA